MAPPFALPGAVDRLRTERGPGGCEALALDATDPADDIPCQLMM